jgi:hypothetical protein
VRTTGDRNATDRKVEASQKTVTTRFILGW